MAAAPARLNHTTRVPFWNTAVRIDKVPNWLAAPQRCCRSIAVYVLLIAVYAITSAEVIDLTNGGIDLGRHLKNGELLLSRAASPALTQKILHTNFYSYTQPDQPFVNHHWLSGVVFHAVYELGGFAGLNAFYIFLGVVS